MFVRVLGALAAVSSVLAMGGALAQEFPSRSIRILVGYPAGGSTDVLARVIAAEIQKTLKQDVVVINKAGAGGALAINELIAAPADGHTLALTPSSVLTLGHHFQDVRADMLEQTDALVMVGRQRTGLFIKADSPIRTFKDFVAQARANPGKLSVGTPGAGTLVGVLTRAVLAHEKADVAVVPMNGDAPVAQAALGGHITAGAASAAGWSQHVRAGTMRLLASTEGERAEAAPDVPTLLEMGYPYRANAIQYVAGPKNLPEAVRKKLTDALTAAAQTPTFVDIARKNELYDAKAMAGDELTAYLLKDRAETAELVKTIGLGKR